MLKITAIGNLTNDVELKCHEDGNRFSKQKYKSSAWTSVNLAVEVVGII